MRNKILGLSLLFIFTGIILLYGSETIEISGIEIPIIEGAKLFRGLASEPVKGKVIKYAVAKPLSEVVSFYASFLKKNGFSVIGGLDSEGSYNASAKKDKTQFTLLIYAQNGLTRLQFIW